MKLYLLPLFLIGISATYAADLKGVVLDSTGTAISGAVINVLDASGAILSSSRSNTVGQFELTQLPAGKVKITISQNGFKTIDKELQLTNTIPATLIQFPMELAIVEQKVEVKAKSGLANSDPVYQQLRTLPVKESFQLENVTITRDAGVFTFRTGVITLSEPIQGKSVFAVFNGDGVFTMKTQLPFEQHSLKNYTGKEEVNETFQEAEFIITDTTSAEIRKVGKPTALDPKANSRLEDFRKRMRSAEHANGANIDAQVLADLLNPKRPGHFDAYIKAKSCSDLRFTFNPFGTKFIGNQAEEVGLDCEAAGDKRGPWFRSHSLVELAKGTASPYEDKRSVVPLKYKIETIIGKNDHLTATALITLANVFRGDRVIEFDLLPTLRVSRVSLNGVDLTFIQQDKKQDGSFYVIMPEPMKPSETYDVLVEYSGDKVIAKAGGGAYYVRARTSWYPSLNSFVDQAPYDLTFKVPKNYEVISNGKLEKSWKEDDYAATHWVSEIPLAVAGFNYGQFKKKSMTDKDTGYLVEGYAVPELPDTLKRAPGMESASPAALLDNTLADAVNTLRIGTNMFGPLPYGRVAISQQPDAFFGQSWPSLVYMPVIAYLDATQRYLLIGRIENGLSEFVEDVGPHEMAHQWWGHLVGWASYRDQWISEGFAEYTAWMVRQATAKSPDTFLGILKRTRDSLMATNNYGQSVNDAGVIWMGHRARSFKNPQASKLIYDKGAYVLHMIRMLMQDPKTGDENFRNMMKEFVSTHRNKNASTESFLAVLDKHITPNMNLAGNNSMAWFFSQWVFGQDVPKYKFTYDVKEEGGKYLVSGHLTQSEVGEQFAMPVPIYGEFDGKMVRTGVLKIVGNRTVDFKFTLPKKPKKMAINYYYDILERK